jgi:putative glutamine amidotransferase
MLIGVTDTLGSEHKFQKYLEWLQQGGKGVRTLTLSYQLDNLQALKQCDGLVLTGGHDVDPALYHGPLQHQTIADVNRRRDDFELQALQYAMNATLPVLGICRGLQLANVFFGGTLIPDLEESGFRSHRSEQDSAERSHPVIVEADSKLFGITNCERGIINSSHHQAARTPGKGLRVVGRSDDGVIEAMELAENGSVPFFLLVQWHPERMTDAGNPFTTNIRKGFLCTINVVTN